MTEDAPTARIQRQEALREQAAAGRERIRRRQEEREALAERAQYDTAAAIEYDNLLRAEQACEPQGSPYMQKSDDDDSLVYKTHDDADWSGWERWIAGHLDIERRRMQDEVVDGLLAVEKDMREEMVEALMRRDREISDLRAEVAECKGMLAATLQLLGNKSADIVDLPRAGWRRDGAA